MNKISFLLCFITTILAVPLHAQHKPARFATIQQGIWQDNAKVKIQPVLTAGVAWNNWSLGLSASIDFFYVQSIQTGIDLRRYFTAGNQRFFIYAVPALNISAPTKAEKGRGDFWMPEKKFKNGWYSEGGIGMMAGKKKNFFAAVAWSRKTFAEQYQDIIYNPVTQKTEVSVRKLDYEYNRLGVKLGVLF